MKKILLIASAVLVANLGFGQVQKAPAPQKKGAAYEAIQEMKKSPEELRAMDKEAKKAYYKEYMELSPNSRKNVKSSLPLLNGEDMQKEIKNTFVAPTDKEFLYTNSFNEEKGVDAMKEKAREVLMKMEEMKAVGVCGKVNDTTTYYDWTGSKWLYDMREIFYFNEATGNPDSMVVYTYDQDTLNWEYQMKATVTYNADNQFVGVVMQMYAVDHWVNTEQMTYTWTADGYVGSETNFEWNMVEEEWDTLDREVYTWDDAGNKLTELDESYSAGEWVFDWRESYTWENGYKTSEHYYNKADDDTYVAFEGYEFDVAGWDVNEGYNTATNFWEDGYWEDDFDVADGLVSAYYMLTGWDPTDGTFTGGDREEMVYVEPAPYSSASYGDILDSYTTYEWDGTEWVGLEKEYGYQYNLDGNPLQYILQQYTTEWVDSLRFTNTYDGTSPKTMTEELWDGSEWLMYYYVDYYNYSYGEILELINKNYDFENDEWTGGSWNQYAWNYDIDYWDAYKDYEQTLDVSGDSPEWVNVSYYEIDNGDLYLGGGEFGPTSSDFMDPNYPKKSYRIYKEWDNVEEEWYVYDFDTTIYNAEGYPTKYTQSYEGTVDYKDSLTFNADTVLNTYVRFDNGQDKAYKEEFTYTTGNENVTEYTNFNWVTDAWVGDYRELSDYQGDTIITSYTEQYWDTDAWVNDYKEEFIYEAVDANGNSIEGIEDIDVDNFDHTYISYSWNLGEEEWDSLGATVYGSDYFITMYWSADDDAYIFDELYYDYAPDPYGFGYDTYGVKYWDVPTGRWWYDFYISEVIASACGGLWFAEYIYGEGSDNGLSMDFIERWERIIDCDLNDAGYNPYNPYNEYDWDEGAQDWKLVYYEESVYEIDEDDNLYFLDRSGYEYNAGDDTFNKVWSEGFAEGEEYDDNGNLIMEYYKDWDNSNASGYRYTYTYDEDDYLTMEIEEDFVDGGIWENFQKIVYQYSGNPELKVAGDVTNVVCYGDSTGSIDITVSGGVGEYTYNWSNDATTEDLSGIEEGVYSVVVTDENDCQLTSMKYEVMTDQPMAMDITTSATDASSMYAIDGMAVAELEGGVPPFTYVWNDRLNTVTEETDSRIDTMMYANPGSYKVIVTDDLGCVAEKLVYVNYSGATGVEDMLNNLGVAAYPNPVNGNLSVQVRDDFIGATVSVMRVNGQVVYSQEMNDNYNTIDMSAMDAGVYFLRTVAGEKVVTQKIIVE